MSTDEVVDNKVILTCFAGRRSSMSILLRYVKVLLARKIINEFHAWNFSRNQTDDEWLQNIFQNKINEILTTHNLNYQRTNNFITQNKTVNLNINGIQEVCISLNIGESKCDICEIVLGSANNTKSFIRRKCSGRNEMVYEGPVFNEGWSNLIKIKYTENNQIKIFKEDLEILSLDLEDDVLRLQIFIASVNTVQWKFDYSEKTNKDNALKLFFVQNKNSWAEYYQYYTKEKFTNCIICKSDDDIVYINIDRFEKHLALRRADKEALLLMPFIINNNYICYNQQVNNIISKDYVGEISFSPSGMGTLWDNGRMCERLHLYFILNRKQIEEDCNKQTELFTVPLNDRVSINFFSILSEDLDVFMECHTDDERFLTQIIPGQIKKPIKLDYTMTMSHLSFYKQLDTGFDKAHFENLYDKLSWQILKSLK
jgi:hypothetical protein